MINYIYIKHAKIILRRHSPQGGHVWRFCLKNDLSTQNVFAGPLKPLLVHSQKYVTVSSVNIILVFKYN